MKILRQKFFLLAQKQCTIKQAQSNVWLMARISENRPISLKYPDLVHHVDDTDSRYLQVKPSTKESHIHQPNWYRNYKRKLSHTLPRLKHTNDSYYKLCEGYIWSQRYWGGWQYIRSFPRMIQIFGSGLWMKSSGSGCRRMFHEQGIRRSFRHKLQLNDTFLPKYVRINSHSKTIKPRILSRHRKIKKSAKVALKSS